MSKEAIVENKQKKALKNEPFHRNTFRKSLKEGVNIESEQL